jgi:dipeptidyl aminopeptidase/acylaminoacyl peptidase
MKRIFFLLLITGVSQAQSLAPLTVEKIMRDPRWIGVSPSGQYWSEDGKQLYFNWNPEKNLGDSLYVITPSDRAPRKVPSSVRHALPSRGGSYNRTLTRKVYEKNGDIFIMDIPAARSTQITYTTERESNPLFSVDEKRVFFLTNGNLYSWEVASGLFTQHTDFRKGSKRPDPKISEQEKWLKSDQLAYFEVLKRRNENRKAAEKIQKGDRVKRPKEIYLDDRSADQIQITPDGNHVTYRLSKSPTVKNTIVPNYVTESGFTEDIPARSKVGAQQTSYEMMIYDILKDTVVAIRTDGLPGIQETPAFRNDYPAKSAKDSKTPKAENRGVAIFGPYWSDTGKNNVVIIQSIDNKDRWLASIDIAARQFRPIDRWHDDAWVSGPANGFGSTTTGWINDNLLWFLSEESGFSHLYSYDMTTGKRQAITSGKYEVQRVELSKDKKFFYLTTNEVHPGEKHFYRLPVTGGKAERLTQQTGAHEVSLSPDGKWMAIRHSYSNKPWELYLQETKPGAPTQQITRSLSPEFLSYPWRDPLVTTFKARDGADVYARLYKPSSPNGAAVIFVHGAGYTQNAHKWWASYFREYMFHNLLADRGYTVLDIDYRASAGYGRDWRTGIYRFMGGKDLEDHVDGARWLAEQHQVDPKRIGIYGGSYGGYITLMAMFTTPDVFASGAALRPVTDWAHYNHGYTSDILNEPFTDSVAYAKSSPIYHAEGLKGHLLICHGMVDVNVHFQDAVRLSQRLIELGKDNWELAVYPMEDHGFVEPSSWTDEYKRIFKLFEATLK